MQINRRARYRIWQDVIRRVKGYKRRRQQWGLCFALSSACGAVRNRKYYDVESDRLWAHSPSRYRMYWFPLTLKGDKRRIALCRKLAGRKPK